ncbi:MAG: alpha/beta hydrolase [Myxococcales bacterium]|nr:alpha/beta hydrolase [Myxococcales bacterium]
MRGFFETLARASRLHPRARPEASGLKVTRDVRYGAGAHARLDVYQPATPGPWPVVMYVHGGAFRILSKDTHWLMGQLFAKQGYLVFNVEYRLAPQHPFPAGLSDVSAAYAFVLAEAARWGGDLGRGLVLAGESAGANLVASLTAMTCFERPEPFAREVFRCGRVPDAVVPACGIFQVSDPERFERRRELPWWLSDRIKETRDVYLGPSGAADHTLADPLLLIESAQESARALPPFFLPVGTADPLLDDTRRLAAALERRGVAHEARYYAGELHAFHALIFRRAARACWADTFSFLDARLEARRG